MGKLYIDTKELKKIAFRLRDVPKQIPGATASALNRTLTHTATKMDREVRNEYAIKSTDVKKTIRKYKASKSKLYARIESKGGTISLSKFPHSPKKYNKRAKNVKVKVKQSGQKVINTQPKAFVQNINGATNIWRRKNRNRNSIIVLRTLSVPQMISNKKTMKKIKKAAHDKLKERVNHEIDWRLGKLTAKGGK
ncbi:prophage minor tail protein Z [Gottschalkia purinilytica]|uniref:Prophage minor tail protein Z n=1 Tax=Gottschalkia purinilytica TaxID=1503 RepID=A0A0L0WAS9_GOTPU|nr:phage tail protein [Gottschalkia purinilytica]KNF08552.1 prophage minor tail protein Z [Gottschalkia purinilytica]